MAGIFAVLVSWSSPDSSFWGPTWSLHFDVFLADTIDDIVAEKLRIVGDLILNGYVIFLFTEHEEDLVGVCALQLAPQLCVPCPSNTRYSVRQLNFCPFLPDNGESKGCVSDILDKVLCKANLERSSLAY